jgi:hypothetical protein
MSDFDRLVADAVLGIDTLWGGDVMNPSGTGRFIADSWFSGAALPTAYTNPTAARVRETGGVSAREPDRTAIAAYLAAVDVHGAIQSIAHPPRSLPRRRRAYLKGVANSFDVMWDLAMEMLGKGDTVAYERCVRASTGLAPQPSNPAARRERVAELLDRAGYPAAESGDLSAASDAWRRNA